MAETDAFAALEKRQWSNARLARSYARSFSRASDMVVPHLVAAVRAGPETEALDLCCGHGNVTAALVREGATVTGLDFSPAMLEMARAAAPQATLVEGDATRLGFGAGAFDAVTVGFGMPHVPDPPAMVREARRVLRPGGRLAFSVWCGPEVDSALGYVFGAIERHGHPDIALPPGPGATDYADRERAFSVLEAAGFGECSRSVVASIWRVEDPGAPYDFFREGTARGEALLRPQPDGNAAAIRAAVVAEVLDRHGGGPVWHVPIPAAVIAAKAV